MRTNEVNRMVNARALPTSKGPLMGMAQHSILGAYELHQSDSDGVEADGSFPNEFEQKRPFGSRRKHIDMPLMGKRELAMARSVIADDASRWQEQPRRNRARNKNAPRSQKMWCSEAEMQMALKVCMPPNAPPEMTFKQILESEYDCLRRASDAARLHCENFTRPMPYMQETDNRALYRRKPLDVRPQVHIGQLKLFLSELQFLTEFGHLASLVVYAGAADGRHIKYLAELFPAHTFHLYDPREFDPSLNGVKNIEISTGENNGYFTARTARWYGCNDTPLLFISDIRSGSSDDPTCDFDQCVKNDMKMQLEWHEEMRPVASMFKFRLSYNPGKTQWFAPMTPQHLKYGIFATKSGTEMRLIVGPNYELREYDNTVMEERSYYFNNFTRASQYGPAIPRLRHCRMRAELGMDDCWDCCAMRDVCIDFLLKKDAQEVCGLEQSSCGIGLVRPVVLYEEGYAIVAHSWGVPNEISSLIAQYACPIVEIELYEFIDAILRNCGKSAAEKMKIAPHGQRAPGVQWIDCMRNYDGAPIYSKKEKPTISESVSRGIRVLYSRSGNIAPPLGVYSGLAPYANKHVIMRSETAINARRAWK